MKNAKKSYYFGLSLYLKDILQILCSLVEHHSYIYIRWNYLDYILQHPFLYDRLENMDNQVIPTLHNSSMMKNKGPIIA